ncbi:major facilitator superfamily domain-containing protein [Zychaea mexicana]|uniref:major facilitator superfamily domain-containing protein n=1 Tax=Zychaea mexicana TaxID=64656 RepID=UPI0022FEE9B4|nr:major facilitator superfamily domain-containing protein [Zychaea mexicana]KAI9496940.1 major facilitator superfamily domain-containing protein [Zychaea mexicana]
MIQVFAKRLLLDQHGKATNFRLHTLQFPHMRALHLAWLSFMVAFMSWYAIPPIVYHIAEDLGISSVEIYDSNMAAVSITIVARLVVGPLCERYGPRRVMALILVCGSIPCGMTGLITNGAGLIGLRCVIGILGATFVPCQFWTTQMFAPSVLGTANAMSAGWGNMGAGITYLLMPAIYDGILSHTTNAIAWRTTFIIPCCICLLVAGLDFFCATDTPHGDWLKLRGSEQDSSNASSSEVSSTDENPDPKAEKGQQHVVAANPVVSEGTVSLEKGAFTGVEEKGAFTGVEDSESLQDVKRNESIKDAFFGFLCVLCKPAVLIMIVHYACSFGTELAVDNVIGQVFREQFALDNSTASYIGSIFGLLNIVSRLSGGLFSDYLAKRYYLSGRILAHCICMVLEGIFLIAFSFSLVNLTTAIVLMIFFSFFVQAVCGSTFGIVPFVDPLNNGKVMGIVGAGGNLGGLIFNLMFREFSSNFESAFLCLGCIALGTGLIGNAILRVQGKMIWHCFNGKHAA